MRQSLSSEMLLEFEAECKPLESGNLRVLADRRTGARYCECHIKASALSPLATVDVPLDPESQAQYRANRQILADDPGFKRMQEDAKKRRAFSNIVAEYTKHFDANHPIKIIGGQHRFTAIQGALQEGVDEYHGVKVYFGLDKSQRLDVQLISNTNIAVSRDLWDRLQETFVGPQLREWCHKVGLLPFGKDFADTKEAALSLYGWRKLSSSIILPVNVSLKISSLQPIRLQNSAQPGSMTAVGIR